MKDLERFVRIAQGMEKAELVLKNAQVFHAFTGEFIQGDIAIAEGRVAGIGSYAGEREIDLAGKYITPGFIDGHVHMESSMLSPLEFGRAVAAAGTTTVIADPHEIANVAGLDGIRYMLEASRNIPIRTYFMLPSCVPATPLEDSGAELLAQDLMTVKDEPRGLGLAELMNVPGVLMGDTKVYDKLRMAEGRRVDGHAPGVRGGALMGYAAAGVHSDHECVTAEEAMERLQAGMYLLIREGSAAKNLRALLPVVNELTAPFCCFVTDDRHPADLIEEGGINHMVRLAVQLGLPAVQAIRMATVNTARYFGLCDLGVIAPHYHADLLVFEDLENWKPVMVFKGGELVAERGRALDKGNCFASEEIEHTVHLKELSKEQLRIPMTGDMARVIGLVPEQIITHLLHRKVKVVNGEAVSDVQNDILKIGVFERHHATGKSGAALVQGFGLKHGAIASTIAHDSHNLLVIGADDEDMLLAARELERISGGIAVVSGGMVLGSMSLPIGGLMTNSSAQEVASAVAKLVRLAHGLGVRECYDPFLTLAFLSLPVIPALKLTDRGLVDVGSFSFTQVAEP